MSAPVVSIVLPTYNHLEFLPAAVEGCLRQDFSEEFELVIVDDGSTDGTREYLSTLDDSRVRVVLHECNKRLPTALNTGMKAARGEFVTWTSADNIMLPHFLQALYNSLKIFPHCGHTHSSFVRIDEQDTVVHLSSDIFCSYPKLLLEFSGSAAFMYRRSLHDIVGYYDPQLEGAEDWDMWLRIMEHTPSAFVPDVTYLYRTHEKSMTARIPDKVRRSSRSVAKNALARIADNDFITLYPAIAVCREQNVAYAEAYCDFGVRILQALFAESTAASLYLERAIRLQPENWIIQHNWLACLLCNEQWDSASRVALQLLKKKAAYSSSEYKDVLVSLYMKAVEKLLKRSDVAAFPTIDIKENSQELFAKEKKLQTLCVVPWVEQESCDPATFMNGQCL